MKNRVFADVIKIEGKIRPLWSRVGPEFHITNVFIREEVIQRQTHTQRSTPHEDTDAQRKHFHVTM